MRSNVIGEPQPQRGTHQAGGEREQVTGHRLRDIHPARRRDHPGDHRLCAGGTLRGDVLAEPLDLGTAERLARDREHLVAGPGTGAPQLAVELGGVQASVHSVQRLTIPVPNSVVRERQCRRVGGTDRMPQQIRQQVRKRRRRHRPRLRVALEAVRERVEPGGERRIGELQCHEQSRHVGHAGLTRCRTVG